MIEKSKQNIYIDAIQIRNNNIPVLFTDQKLKRMLMTMPQTIEIRNVVSIIQRSRFSLLYFRNPHFLLYSNDIIQFY